MSEAEQIAQQLELLKIHRRTLAVLVRQRATLGPAYAPPSVITSIQDACGHIQRIKVYLQTRNQPVDDQPDDTYDLENDFPPRVVPDLSRPVPGYYIERSEIESKLEHALLNQDTTLLISMYGPSGMGKSTLLAHMAQKLKSHFVDGIFWGDLADYTPRDQFLTFLAASGSALHEAISDERFSFRDEFWRLLAERHAQSLIIFDNVVSAEQLRAILPTHVPSSRSRIVVVSLHDLEIIVTDYNEYQKELLYKRKHVQVPAFKEHEADDLYEKLIGSEKRDRYHTELQEITRRLEARPYLIAAFAKELAEEHASPLHYAMKLRNGKGDQMSVQGPIQDSLALLTQALSEDERDIFEMIGVLGDSQWSIAMLAAVALRPTAELRVLLAALAKRDLVRPAGDDRFTTNVLTRLFAARQFGARPTYVRNAAYQLLARYCLDLAQSVDGDTNTQSATPADGRAPAHALTPARIRTFRACLLPEVKHIERVLQWATANEQWEVVLRFSQVAFLELHEHLLANSFEIRKQCQMATLLEPIVWEQGEQRAMHVESHAQSSDWHVQPPHDDQDGFSQISDTPWLRCQQEQAIDLSRRCEVSLDLTACHIRDGVFVSMCFVDTIWKGVRASQLICRHVDFVGSRLLSCDLTSSIWVDCDARRVVLSRSSLRCALLRHVRLHGADLRGVDLGNAILEYVDLRGADLREANLTGAVLIEVDLRGADLRGANFTAIRPERLNLADTLIDGSCWSGVNITGIEVSDATMIRIIELSGSNVAVVPAQLAIARPSAEALRLKAAATPSSDHRAPEQTEIRSNFAETDLRALDLEGLRLSSNHVLRGADLRATRLVGASLPGVVLNQAQLRASDLTGANLARAHLINANLSAATLARATFDGADLAGTTLRNAYAHRASFTNAKLVGADARNLLAARAVFEGADLAQADLVGAKLEHARFQGATLRDARLSGADLSFAFLTDVNFAGTICDGVNFRDAEVADHQLAEVSRLDNAFLPDGQPVRVFGDTYEASAQWPERLRFAHFDGIFKYVDLSGQNLVGVHLDGHFTGGSFSDANMSFARLGGHFVDVTLSVKSLQGARLSGVFHQVEFGVADFSDVRFDGAILVDVDLSKAENITDDQLRMAHQLHYVRLPGGLYDGRFNLAGDREAAQAASFDPDDPAEMAEFLASPRPRFRKRK